MNEAWSIPDQSWERSICRLRGLRPVSPAGAVNMMENSVHPGLKTSTAAWAHLAMTQIFLSFILWWMCLYWTFMLSAFPHKTYRFSLAFVPKHIASEAPHVVVLREQRNKPPCISSLFQGRGSMKPESFAPSHLRSPVRVAPRQFLACGLTLQRTTGIIVIIIVLLLCIEPFYSLAFQSHISQRQIDQSCLRKFLYGFIWMLVWSRSLASWWRLYSC